MRSRTPSISRHGIYDNLSVPREHLSEGVAELFRVIAKGYGCDKRGRGTAIDHTRIFPPIPTREVIGVVMRILKRKDSGELVLPYSSVKNSNGRANCERRGNWHRQL